MSIPILSATNDQKVFRKSSITQFKDTLSVLKKGEWLPLVADHIDYIDCDKVVSHKTAITDKKFIGYAYPVKECVLWTEVYLLGHSHETITESLPEWFGTGFYETVKDKDALVTGDGSSLGLANKYLLRVGMSYCQAEETLDPVA